MMHVSKAAEYIEVTAIIILNIYPFPSLHAVPAQVHERCIPTPDPKNQCVNDDTLRFDLQVSLAYHSIETERRARFA